MMRARLLHVLLVGVQVLAAAGLALSAWWWGRWYATALEIAGALLGAWAVFEMRRGQLRLGPNPAQGASLVDTGPYRLIRHPMYAALLLLAGGWLLQDIRWWRVVLYLILLADLMVKLRVEESILRKQLPGYTQYMQRTWRLIPGLF